MCEFLSRTDAIWEQSNLGCRVVELDVTADHDIHADVIRNAAKGAKYVVIRVPLGYSRALATMAELRATFREMQILYARNIDTALTDQLCAFQGKTSVRRISSEDEIRGLTEQVVTGMFTTDRIALDASFGPMIAARRYRNWLTQSFHSGSADIYTLHTRASCVGFLMVQAQPKVLRYLLGGLFPTAQGSGLGVHLVAQVAELCRHQGMSRVEAAVSSNNLPIIGLYQYFGFQIVLPKTSYVFTLSP